MCGRYVLIATFEEIEVRYYVQTKEVREVWRESRNIGVGMLSPVITGDKPDRLQLFQFGLTPHWANKRMYFFNARAEGERNKENDPNYSGAMEIILKPAFRKAIRSQRCLIPATGFIEGPEKEKLSKPYYVYMKEQKIFALAGIWDTWIDKENGGEVVNSFAIVTTVANPLIQKFGHHRSPVIVPRGKEALWLNPQTPLHYITGMLQPYPYQEMNAYPINAKIKNPKCQDEDVLKPMGELLVPEVDYRVRFEQKLAETKAQKRGKRDEEGKLTLAEKMKLTDNKPPDKNTNSDPAHPDN